MNLPDKQAPVALITGAGRRIGAAIAKYLHQNHYNVIVHCNQSKKDAQILVNSLNQTRKDSALLLSADLTIKSAVNQLVKDTIDWAGQLNILVNNASRFIKTDIKQPSDNDWDDLFNTNVKAPFWLSHTTYPYLAKQKGIIINLTDIHADKPLKDYAVYCQTKAALVMQTKSLAREFAPLVRVNAVAPGAIAWPEHDNQLTSAIKEQIIKDTPLQTHGHPQFIAQAVFSLVENPFITGEILRVDGGRSII